MKLSWFNTSEAHKQYQAYIWYEQYDMDAMHNIRESLEIVDQSQTQRYVSWLEPLLYVPAFTQKDFHYNVHTGLPTQGTSTEKFGNYKLGVLNSSLQQNNLYTRGKAQQQSPLHLEGWAQS